MTNRNDEENVTVTQTLTAEDFSAASAAVKYFAGPMNRRSVRAALCLTVAVLFGSTFPAFHNLYHAEWVSVCGAAVSVALAAVLWFSQPVLTERQAISWFHSCPLMALPSTVTVLRDRVVMESDCERMTEYWTDFALCVETETLIAAVSGPERSLLVVKKQGLSAEESERLSTLFRYAFEGRYFRSSGKGGV